MAEGERHLLFLELDLASQVGGTVNRAAMVVRRALTRGFATRKEEKAIERKEGRKGPEGNNPLHWRDNSRIGGL